VTDPRVRDAAATSRPVRVSGPRGLLTRRRLGRAIMVAAVVAAVTCLIGAVVAWQFLGALRDRSQASLRLVESTLINVDESLAIAQDVTATVGGSVDTLRDSLVTIAGSVVDAAATLDVVANLTETVPPALDRVDSALGGVSEAAGVVDRALEALDSLPIGPDLASAGLSQAVDDVRADLRPIADELRSSTDSIRELSASSAELTAQLEELDGDLVELNQSLDRSSRLLDDYRADAAEAVALAEDSLDELDRDVAILRFLALVLALAIAVGQVAPFHLGRQLARTGDPDPEDTTPASPPAAAPRF
jgi:methyl-accepting chemotaxis protein